MKKRVLAALLCAAMVVTSLVGCTGNPSDSENPSSQTSENDGTEGNQPGTQNPDASAKLSVDPVVYYPMESLDEGWTVVKADASKLSNLAYDVANLDSGAARSIVAADASVLKTQTGVKGNSVYLDRNYGLNMNFQPTNTDAWAVSFWLCTSGMSNYMPSLQMGNNVGYPAAAGNNVTWLNITQTDWVGATFPILWSRNEASAVTDENGTITTDCFPWMSAYDTEKLIYGRNEWVHITIVATGDIYDAPLGNKAAGAQLYINGELRYDSYDNFMNSTYFEITDTEGNATMAPNIMKPTEGQTFEAYFGINYWDTMFRGCVDEFYVFDKAITADDVKTLYAQGDTTVVPELYDPNAPKENPTELLGENSVGMNNYTQAWFTDFSDIYKVESGATKTITFYNYHTNLDFANWFNAAVILQSTPTGHSSDPANAAYAEGYSEYAVVRMDNYGWGTGYDNIATATGDWDFGTADAFKNATHGATVVLKVTNHGTTADIVMEVTALDGKVYHQSYTGIAVTGDVYTCLTVEKACIDIISVE